MDVEIQISARVHFRFKLVSHEQLKRSGISGAVKV